jgi:hypothetical protein
MILSDSHRMMSKRINVTVSEVKGSHAVYVLDRRVLTALVEQAAIGAAVVAKTIVQSRADYLRTFSALLSIAAC